MRARNHCGLLAEDGIIDPVAVEVAAAGLRDVRLTPAEQKLAAARIMDTTGKLAVVCYRLRISASTAARIIHHPATESVPAQRPEPNWREPGTAESA